MNNYDASTLQFTFPISVQRCRIVAGHATNIATHASNIPRHPVMEPEFTYSDSSAIGIQKESGFRGMITPYPPP